MVETKEEYTRAVGKARYANSAAKTLIYGPGDNVTVSVEAQQKKARRNRGEVPFATCEGAEDGKYPTAFTLRKRGTDGADKIGGRKEFDPEVYREQIRAYNSSKVAAPQRAYKGAGDILRHPGASRRESQQVHQASAPPSVIGEHGAEDMSVHADAAPSEVPDSTAAMAASTRGGSAASSARPAA